MDRLTLLNRTYPMCILFDISFVRWPRRRSSRSGEKEVPMSEAMIPADAFVGDDVDSEFSFHRGFRGR